MSCPKIPDIQKGDIIMRILKRIVYSTTNANRTPYGAKVVPKFPNIPEYEKDVVKPDKNYREILECFNNDIPMDAVTNDDAQGEIGYLLEHNDRLYAVPTQCLKSFMDSYNVQVTEPSDTGISLTSYRGGIVIMGNNKVSQYDPSILYIYETDSITPVETRVSINKSFRVRKKVSIQTITPKGLIKIPGLKLVRQNILGVMRGEVIDVSWSDEFK